MLSSVFCHLPLAVGHATLNPETSNLNFLELPSDRIVETPEGPTAATVNKRDPTALGDN